MPAGGLAVVRCLKEGVSERGPGAGCPLSKSARSAGRAGSFRRRLHKGGVRCVPRFLVEEASGGKGAWPP